MQAADDKSIADWVTENPARALILEKHRIDYCCGGQRTLDQACQEKGIPVEAVIAQLESLPVDDAKHDWREAELAELTAHIVKRHHAFLRNTMPSIREKLARVIEAHAQQHGERLRRLREIFAALDAELTQHMAKEEQVLFPLAERMEAAGREGAASPPVPGGSVRNPIRMMEHEHENAGRALKRMRELTNDYAPPPDACASFRALYAQLEELERDLRIHIHLENNILFPRSAAIEERPRKT